MGHHWTYSHSQPGKYWGTGVSTGVSGTSSGSESSLLIQDTATWSHSVLQKQLSSLSSQVLHNLPLLEGSGRGLRILHLIQLEKLLPLRLQWSKKKNPQWLYQESSQRAGVSSTVSAARDTAQHQQAPLCLGSSSGTNWPHSSNLALHSILLLDNICCHFR